MMLYRLLQRIDREQFDPVVVTLLDISGPLTEKVEEIGVEVRQIKLRTWYDFMALIRLYRIFKELKPDILHTQLFAADILGRIMGRLLKVPVVITSIRNIYYGSMFRYHILRWTEKFADRTTFVSRAAADRFVELKILPASKVKVIHNGLDPGKFETGLKEQDKKNKRKQFALPLKGLLLLSVGSLSRQKGNAHLFQALKKVKQKRADFYLVIAGSGPEHAQLKKEIIKRVLADRVIMIGRCDDVAGLMAAADALVLSSLWEGLPGVVMEAMAAELPVVATAVGGTPELVLDGETGFLVARCQHEELASALEKLMAMLDEERKAMGRAGRRRVEEHFHVDTMVRSYQDLYRAALSEKNIL